MWPIRDHSAEARPGQNEFLLVTLSDWIWESVFFTENGHMFHKSPSCPPQMFSLVHHASKAMGIFSLPFSKTIWHFLNVFHVINLWTCFKNTISIKLCSEIMLFMKSGGLDTAFWKILTSIVYRQRQRTELADIGSVMTHMLVWNN